MLVACGGDDARPAAREPPAELPERPAARPLTSAEKQFASAFAAALARDVRRHGPGEPLVRAVVRWHEPTDPLYFTVHVLTSRQRRQVRPADAWYPLEWPNVDAEMERTDRLNRDAAIRRTGRRLAARYQRDPDVQDEIEGWGDGLSPSPVIVEIVRRVPEALRDAGVDVHDELAVSAAHFEGYGALPVLRATAQPGVIAALDRRGELPAD